MRNLPTHENPQYTQSPELPVHTSVHYFLGEFESVSVGVRGLVETDVGDCGDSNEAEELERVGCDYVREVVVEVHLGFYAGRGTEVLRASGSEETRTIGVNDVRIA